MMNFSTVHNYYERLVFDQLNRITLNSTLTLSESELTDIACIALKTLPPRYVRYDVDTSFFLTSEDRTKLNQSMIDAVNDGIRYIADHRDHAANSSNHKQA